MFSPSFGSFPSDTSVERIEEQYHIHTHYGKCIYIPQLFTTQQELFDTLLHSLSWHQDQICIYGKLRTIPRAQAWYGEYPYTYSGLTLAPQPLTPELVMIKQQVERIANTSFNSVLANLYQDGSKYMNWHSDNELELGMEPIIASVSLGAERDFVLRLKHHHSYKLRFALASGSTLIMGHGVQTHFEHALPKRLKCKSSRINLTFRFIVPID